ncbi:hypothetical protein KAM338_48030 [Aeromonas caviae]|nr:hypothetical protein KAM330_38070 [Aeromonas hydrophila]GKQ64626.1 hypothetical protein KAM338_48030 [Aeromonas caviae]
MITLNMGSDFAWQSETLLSFHASSMGYVHAPTYMAITPAIATYVNREGDHSKP